VVRELVLSVLAELVRLVRDELGCSDNQEVPQCPFTSPPGGVLSVVSDVSGAPRTLAGTPGSPT